MHPQIQIDKPADAPKAPPALVLQDEPVALSRAQAIAQGRVHRSYFEEDGEFKIVHYEDVTAVLDDCKARHNEAIHGHKETRHLAQIPASVVEKYCFTRGVPYREFIRDKAHMKVILNDPDLRGFRIYPGRV